MEDWQLEILERNKPGLITKTDCNAMLLAMLAKHISQIDRNELEAEIPGIPRASKFYEKLEKKKDSFYDLVTALRSSHTKSSGALDILLKEIKKHEETRGTLQVQPEGQARKAPNLQSASGSDVVIKMTENEVIDFINKKTPLTVIVKRPSKQTKMTVENGNDKSSYQLPVRDKGLVLIVNITEFDDETKNRPGATIDKEYMTDLWEDLGYRVRIHDRKIYKKDLEDIIKKFKQEVERKKPESIVVFIGSHGKLGHVITSEGNMVNVHSKIVYQFNSKVCTVLNGKPKIFLISACQTFPDVVDRTKTDEICEAPMEDTMLVLSSTPGYLSKTDDLLGGWFTYCFTKIFMEHAHDTEFGAMLDMVQETMKNIDGRSPDGFSQVCCPSKIGSFKTLYFPLEP